MEVTDPERIILIDLLYLGDLIFATPFIRNLRHNFPAARFDLVANSSVAPILADNPYLDRIYAYDKEQGLIDSWRFACQVASNNYDLGINIHGNWRTALLLRLIKPEYSLGFGTKGRGLFLDRSLSPTTERHMVEVYLDLLRQLGLAVDDNSLELAVKADSRQKMKDFLSTEGISLQDPLVALNIGGSWPTKRWPLEKSARLADRLQQELAVQVVFLGGPTDVERVTETIDLMETSPVTAAGQTSLPELAALVSLCDLVISTDSGPVHVAAGVGTKTVAIFGPSDEEKFRPFGSQHQVITNDIDCRPCGEHQCPEEYHNCLAGLEIERIIDNLELSVD